MYISKIHRSSVLLFDLYIKLCINLHESFNIRNTLVMDIITNTVNDKVKPSEYLNTNTTNETINDEEQYISEEKLIKVYNPLTLRYEF